MPNAFVPDKLRLVVPLAVEIDRPMLDLYERALDLEPEEALEWARNLSAFYKAELSVIREMKQGPTPCWNLQVSGIPATLAQTRKAQIAISREIGMWPAMLYEYLEEYDSNFDELYSQYVRANCAFFNPFCVRPGHLRPCNMNLGTLKTLLSIGEFNMLRGVRLKMKQESRRP